MTLSHRFLLSSILLLFACSAEAGLPPGIVWERVDSKNGHQANDLVGISSAVVAVGNEGAIWRSTDRENWTVEKSGTTDALVGIAEGNGVLVTVGAAGRILRSSTPGVWTIEQSGVSADFESIAYGSGIFVAVGRSGRAVYSADGRKWTSWTTGVSRNLHDVTWDGSSFIVVGDAGTALSATPFGVFAPLPNTPETSTHFDRIAKGSIGSFIGPGFIQSNSSVWTWLGDRNFNDVAAGAGVFVGVSDSGVISASDDGVQWSPVLTTSLENFRSVTWTGVEFIAITDSGRLAFSSNGYRWKMLGFFRQYGSGCWDGSQYVLVGGGGIITTSPDAKWWTAERNPRTDRLYAVTSGGGMLVGVGEGGCILSSPDGTNWQNRSLSGSWSLLDVHWSGSAFWAVGTGGIILSSTNGMNWTISAPAVTTDTLRSVTSGNGRLVVATAASMISSVNGVNWAMEPLAANLGISSRVRGIWTGDQFAFVIGSSVWTSATGLGWTKSGSAPGCNGLYDIKSFNGNLVLAGWAMSSSASGIWNVVDGQIQPGAAWFDNFSSLVSDGSRILAFGSNPSSISNNGTTWTKGEYGPTLSRTLNDVIHTPMGFFAVDGELLKSTDGRNWGIAETNLVSIPSSAMVYADGRIVTVGSNGLAASTDGISWSYTFKSDFYRDVEWGNGRYVAVSSSKTASSNDGVTWQFASQVFALEAVVWTGTEFLATNTSGAVLTSDDGLTWRYRVIPGSITGYAYGNGIHVVATSTGEVFHSSDLVNWTRVFKSGSGLVRVVFAGNRFFLFGSQTYRSSDALTWTALTRTYQDMVWTGSQYVGVGAGGVVGLSTDATTWTQKATTTTQALRAAVWTGDQIVAVGNAGAAVTSADGNSWTSLNFSTTANLIDVAWTGTDLLALVADGSIAGLLPSPTPPAGFNAKALFSDGSVTLIADASGRIAKLDSGGWQESLRITGSLLNAVSNTTTGFIATGERGMILQSNDGIAWAAKSGWNQLFAGVTTTEIFQVKSVIDGKPIALGTKGNLLDSADGSLWKLRATSVAGAGVPLNACVQSGVDLVTVGNNGKIVVHSNSSGEEVASRTMQNLMAIASAGDRLVAVGAAGTILYSGSGSDVPDCYESWIDGQGAARPSSSASDDPNRDGIANLTAYLFGLPATGAISVAEREFLPRCVHLPGGPGIQLEIIPDHHDLELILERTSDLRNWSEVSRKTGGGAWGGPAVATEEPATGGRRRFTMIAPPPPGTPASFYRLRHKLR